MKIKQLDVKGFKSLKDVSWRPGDLNVVIGQNGTGKSNLLRMLELISVAAQGQGKLSKYIQNAGGMGAIVWDGAAPSIYINLATTGPEYNYELGMVRLGMTSSYFIQPELLTSRKLQGDNGEPSVIKHMERTESSLEEARLFGYNPREETLLSDFMRGIWGYGEPDVSLFCDRLSGITVYHDLNVGQDSKIRQAPVARFEKRVEPDGQNLVTVLHTLYTGDREFERSIDSAMHAAFGGDYEKLVFPPAADQRVQLRVRWRTLQREQSAVDLSDGTLRFLLLLTTLTAPDPPMLIAIDEPETGLHPAMMNIVAEYAVEAAMRTQLVFTTHSAQFLDAFTKNKPTTTVTKWENGETSLHTLEGEALEYWLKDYSLGALFESGQLEAMT